jgi:hypothetical protein
VPVNVRVIADESVELGTVEVGGPRVVPREGFEIEALARLVRCHPEEFERVKEQVRNTLGLFLLPDV